MSETISTEAKEASTASWHALDAEAALAALASSPEGLSAEEAASRLQANGPNRLPGRAKAHPLLRFLQQFHNVLIYVLLVAALLAGLLGHVVDSVVILIVVLLNALIGYVQEGKAEDSLDAIRKMIDPTASVLRAGRRMAIKAEELAPGEVVLLEAGDRVSADLRLIDVHNLRIEEAALTGESVPVGKQDAAVAADAPLGDRRCMAYSGTLVVAGQGKGVVVATGVATQLGQISRLVGEVATLKTPLIRRMDQFSRQITAAILMLSVVVLLFAHYVRGYPFDEAFMIVVGLAVAAIPEGLPAVMTITLAIGVRRMAQRNAIIRRLPAVETLGSVTTICSDKTGTLTRNEMTVGTVVTAARHFTVSGSGYAPEGAIEVDGGPVDVEASGLNDLLLCAALCNDAELQHREGRWQVVGDPMEAALITLAHKGGLSHAALKSDWPRRDVIPFDTAHRYMGSLNHNHAGEVRILIKGAPERLLDMCATQSGPEGPEPLDRDLWTRRIEEVAAGGQRVLALAHKPLSGSVSELRVQDAEAGAELLGLVGLIDPPRAEAVAAVAECQQAGIRVVMITGDHVATASAIAAQLGLHKADRALGGKDLDALDAGAFRERAADCSVFARTTPEHKLRLVEALQSDGQVVAMTGDGVNDAPALKRADVGVAMGGQGSEAAKEAAAVVLADDNFASIVAAVREGRTVYDNLMKVIGWTLPTNGGQALAICAAVAGGLALPVTPVQILWVNMICAVALGTTLAFEPTEPGTMRRPPRPTDSSILSGRLLWQIIMVSLLFVAGVFGVMYWSLGRGDDIELARTLVVNTLVVMGIAYLFGVRFVHGTSLTWRGALGTPAVLAGLGITTLAQVAFTYLPFLQQVFHTRSLGLLEIGVVLGVGVVLLLLVECEKAVVARWFGSPG